jgi:hypothetical protein
MGSLNLTTMSAPSSLRNDAGCGDTESTLGAVVFAGLTVSDVDAAAATLGSSLHVAVHVSVVVWFSEPVFRGAR